MRYNTYRQYKTLSGVHGTTKASVIENLHIVTKDIARFISREKFTEMYNKYVSVRFVLEINKDNTVRQLLLNGYSSTSFNATPVESYKIDVPKNSIFYFADNGIDSQAYMEMSLIDSDGNRVYFNRYNYYYDDDDSEWKISTQETLVSDDFHDISQIVQFNNGYGILADNGTRDRKVFETQHNFEYMQIRYRSINGWLSNYPKMLVKCLE